MKTFDSILFATDFSENSEKAFDYALSLAKAYNAKLLILHVINEPVDLRGFYVPHISFETLEKEIEEGAEKMMASFCGSRLSGFSNFETRVVTGIPADEIVRIAEEMASSLIVLGTQGRTGLDHFLFGSTAERVVRTARCPVLTVRLSGTL